MTAVHVHVPKTAKAAMTGIQISQFLIAYMLTIPFLFIRYDIPVSFRTGLNGDRTICNQQRPSNLSQKSVLTETECEYGYETISCLQNSGEAAVLWMGFLYGAPLTYMFVQFFTRSYRHLGGEKLRKVEWNFYTLQVDVKNWIRSDKQIDAIDSGVV